MQGGSWNYPGVLLTLGALGVVAVVTQQTTTTTGPPYIMKHPRNITAVEGQRVLFSCGAEAFPGNITYYWYKDGTDVRQLPVHTKRLTLSGDSLLLTGVVKEDMGWYTCRPSNGIGQDEASAYLNVTYLPRVLAKRMNSQAIWAKGFREKLDCPVDSNPPMVRTVWTKDQRQLLGSRGRWDILLNGTLLVSNVQEQDGGSYSCTPISAVGEGLASPNIQVIVRDPPYFTLRPQPLYQRQVDQLVLLPCAASGTPSPSIAWKKVGGVIDFSDNRITQNGGNLSISAAAKEDHGKYECVASNTIATIVSPTELTVLNTTPHAPYNVTIVPGLFSAELSWAPAYDGGRPQFYMLWFRRKGGQWGQLTIPRDQPTTFTVYSLQPNTDYEFMVLSRNDLGNGSFSPVAEAKTLGYRPDLVTALPTDASGVTYFPQVIKSLGPQPTPAGNVTAKVVDDDVILVSWLPSVTPPVPVFWYEVHYRLAGSSRWTRYSEQVATTSGTRLEMRDLHPGVYQIRVLAYGVLAFSMPSNLVTVDMSKEEQLIPDAMIGGIVGGVLFLLVAVLLTTMAIIHSRRKDSKARNGHTNYGVSDVSYGKPEDMNSLQQAPAKRDRWQQNGGGDVVTSVSRDDSIFFLPHSHARDLHPTSDLTSSRGRDPRFYDYDDGPSYKNDPGYQVTRSPPHPHNNHPHHPHSPPAYKEDPHSPPSDRYHPHPHLSYQGSQPLVVSDTQPLVTSGPRPCSRSHPSVHSHRFPSDPYDPRSPWYRDAPFAYPRYPEDALQQRDPQTHHHHRPPSSQPPPPYRSSGGSGEEEYPPKPARAYDGPYRARDDPRSTSQRSLPRGLEEDSRSRGGGGLPRGFEDSSPHRGGGAPRSFEDSPSRSGAAPPQRGYDGPFHSFHSEEDDDVFPSGTHSPHHHHHPHQPPPPPSSSRLPGTFPRHSSMKPGSAPNVGEGEGEGEGEEVPAFTLSDISSVLEPPLQDQSTLSLPPPRRSWEPSQESSTRSVPPHGEDSREGRPRDPKPLAQVWPSPKVNDDSSDSSGRPLGYTREQLHDVVHRLRQAPRPPSTPGDRYLDVSAQDPRGGGAHRDFHPGNGPGDGGRSRAGYPASYPSDPRQAEDHSTSSGIGSRNTSQSTSGSLRTRGGKPTGNSMSSLLTPHESSIAEEDPSLQFGDSRLPHHHRRDTSADENYEFDHLPALESDILDDLHRYSRLAGSGHPGPPGLGPDPPGEMMRELYPKPQRQSQYADAAERFEKLREEFQNFRQQQGSSGSPPYAGPESQPPLYSMDSEML
ncbi:hypothetical protein ACOMHN_065697 [Nucella lapillus]